jgi:sulfate transport system ATP-binding protein
MPLQIEILVSDYQGAAAFAVASLLALLALVTLAVKTLAEWSQASAVTQATAHEQPQTTRDESRPDAARPGQARAARVPAPLKLAINGVSKRFGGSVVLNGVSLDIAEGELVVLLGPSGCGKTTLLRLVAGLEPPDGGTLVFPGAETGQKRPVGLIFQNYALFPHLTVFDNVAFGLTLKKNRTGGQSRSRVRDRVFELLAVVRMDALADRYPAQLSGGQSQRVAMARALAVEPGLLLLDEPFSALDAKIRKEMRVWLLKLRQELGLTCIFVTHDQQEALELADRVVLMHQGRIEQVGAPRALWQSPASPFVADFLGAH